ncbi:MAG: Rrf2 family transcriptional regulator [Terriglobales bacterium]|jgi:Rrf2 family protein
MRPKQSAFYPTRKVGIATMLKLTKKADYGLMAMKHLAEHADQGACSAKDVAEAYGIPQEALAKILQRLAKVGLIRSQHGINGGYTLTRDPKMISAFEVIKAIDGPLFITSCVTVRGECGQSNRCTIREPLRKVNESIEQVLKNIKISQMQEEPEVLDLTAQETAVRGTNGPDPKKTTELVTIST